MLLVFAFSSDNERGKFDSLYSLYKNLMFKIAAGILGDHMLAEDAVSEAFIRIYKNLHKIDDPASGRSASFVATVVKNTALSLLRKSGESAAGFIEETAEDGFDLEEDIIARLSSEKIYTVISCLSEEMRGVFLLKYAHGLSHREIGGLLRISENNVTVRLHRAKKKLALLLREEGYPHGA